MATDDLPPENQTDTEGDDSNLGQKNYNKQVSGGAYADAELKQAEANAGDPNNADGPWKTDIGEGYDLNKPKWSAALGFAKKKKGVLGLVAIFGVSGGLMASFFGPSSMLISLMENFTSTNDSSSTALERRILKIFGNFGNDTSMLCSSSKIKCKMGKLSNSAIRRLASKGVTALDANGSPMENNRRTGYPERNPAQYEVELNGKKTTIPASELVSHLVANPRTASKVLGVKGAFNLKRSAWVGKYITKKFYNKFGIKRSGGIADGKNSTKNSDGSDADTNRSVMKKLRDKIPGIDKLDGATAKIKSKVGSHLGKAKKGGVGYLSLVAGCIAVKAPAYIAGAVAAVQLAQILPISSDSVLSPGSKAQASAAGSGFTGEDANAAGVLLTNKTPRKSDGKMTAAVDSPILQYAAGVNKNPPAVSEDFTPGYAAMTYPAVLAARKADKATESQCNAIMSPAAMYSAMAVDAAVTVAASATVVLGIIKVAASLIISEVVSEVAQDVAGDLAAEAITSVAENDAIPKAEGEEMGDVIGISAIAFFGAGSMSRSVPGLTESQLASSDAIKAENDQFNRNMDVASLSPFDTSSKYTFLGSIVNNVNLGLMSSGSYNDSPLSILSNIIRIPGLALSSPNAGAAQANSAARCSYAKYFMLDNTEDPNLTPAISLAGTPCTGLTPTQATMSTDTAISLLENEGWIDNSIEIDDSDTIDDLVSKGVIKGGTPLMDYLDTCSDASSGDYLFNAASCASQDSLRQTSNNISTIQKCGEGTNEDGETAQICANEVIDDTSSEPDSGVTGVSSQDALLAIPVFLLDYQLVQIVNGEDEDDFSEDSQGASIDFEELYNDSSALPCDPRTTDEGVADGYREGTLVRIKLCGIAELGGRKVNARVSENMMDLLEGLKTEGVTISATSGFRTNEEQAFLDEGGSNDAAPAGFSNHQMGLAMDFKFYDESGGAIANQQTDCVTIDTVCQPPRQSSGYTWLVNNASRFGYSQLKTEFWHWEVKQE